MLKRQGQRWTSSTSIKWRVVIVVSATAAILFLVVAITSTGSDKKPHVSFISLTSTIPVAAEIEENDAIAPTPIPYSDRLQAINHLKDLLNY